MDTITENHEAFDIAIALYNWCSHNYNGMSCEKYAVMSSLVSTYKMSNIPENDENTEFYYNDLDENNWEETKQELFRYLDNDWENNSY